MRIVRTELPGGVTDFFENVAVAPAGRPATESATGDAKPPVPLTETVYVVDWPRATVRVPGVTASVKSADGGAGATTSVTPAV